MKRFSTLLLCMCLAPALWAQAPGDSGAGQSRAAWRERFREQREARIREALGLTPDQAAKLTATQERFAGQRQSALTDARSVREALRAQLRPGVAANVDSVRKLLDAEEHSAAALAQLRRDERHEMATYLSPVQLAQWQLMRARMVRFAMRGRMRGGPGRGHPSRGGEAPDGPEGHGPEPT